MASFYTITYQTENTYESPVIEATWQFLIVPEENNSQSKPTIEFSTSEGTSWELSKNGFGFPVIRVRNRNSFQKISFQAIFKLHKQTINPYNINPESQLPIDPNCLLELDFQMQFDQFLQHTPLTFVSNSATLFQMDWSSPLLENLLRLNRWVYEEIEYAPGITNVDSKMTEVLDLRKGVCQDFSHLFIGIARSYGIPARYISGYLHQGQGFVGDAQMHAWVEAYLPKTGWIGFDPTNNILACEDHIKVAHGRDYEDCAPIKGVVFGHGGNTSLQRVQVLSQEQ